MSVVLRAEDVPAAARAEYVREVVAAALGPLEVRAGEGTRCPDQVRVADLGAVRVGELSASRPGGADRRRRHIQAMDADLCKVDVVARGEVVLEQDGRQARLHAGDFAFVDLSRPAHWTNGWSTRVVAIAFPLTTHLGEIDLGPGWIRWTRSGPFADAAAHGGREPRPLVCGRASTPC